MKRHSLFYIMLLAALIPFCATAGEFTKYVNPRIGTGGHGHVFLGANVPFGFVQLGPTEHTRGWDWCSGYHDSDNVLLGFSHTHLSGTGIGDLGDITLLPVASVEQDTAVFNHSDETVRAGYYSVNLHNPDVTVELTATERCGMHRYTFHKDAPAYIRLDLNIGIGWDKVYASDFQFDGASQVSGLRFSTGWAKDQKVYFTAQFSQPLKLVKSGQGYGVFQLSKPGEPLLVRVGLSATSIDGAKRNLQAEINNWDFDRMAKAADEAWEKQLAKINISASDEVKQIYYTAVYHAFNAPSIFNDVDGSYRGADGQVHRDASGHNYTTFSLWDTYRAEMPLLSVVEPTRAADMGRTFLRIADEQGRLPVWHLMGNETDCMVGNPGVIALADMVLKGLVTDKQHALEAMKTTMETPGRSLELFNKYGYIPMDLDPTHETVAKTLEYAIAADAVGRVANSMGDKQAAELYTQRGKAYQQLFDPQTQFMRGRSVKKEWRTPFNPFHAVHRMDDYTEGNAWQYTWLVPQDVHGLVKCFPSEKAFCTKLDSLFIVQGDLGAEASPDISGLIGQYAHGNEPSQHIIYMYNYICKPYKAAPLLRKVMKEMYTIAKDGLCGNEDVGQMSAWYVLSAIGLYQVEPAGGPFIIGSPVVNKATIQLESGKTFTVEAKNNSDSNIYVQSVQLNGKPLSRSYITYKQLMQGGKLTLVMGSKPSKWGTKKNERP